MAFPLIVLCFGSVFLGYLTKDMFIGLGTPFFNNAIKFTSSSVFCGAEFFVPFRYKILPVIFSLIGCFSLIILQVLFEKLLALNYFFFINTKLKKLYNFLIFKWYFDYIYNHFINCNI